MATSEEIREGIDRILKGYPMCGFPKAKCRKHGRCSVCLTDDVLTYLESQGVVRIVDVTLPHNIISMDYQEGEQDMLKAGYFHTSPLIEPRQPETAGAGFQYHPGKEN